MTPERLPRTEFIRQALIAEIAIMLAELGNPPLVAKIFPNGWANEPADKLGGLYDLCLRTFASNARKAAA